MTGSRRKPKILRAGGLAAATLALVIGWWLNRLTDPRLQATEGRTPVRSLSQSVHIATAQTGGAPAPEPSRSADEGPVTSGYQGGSTGSPSSAQAHAGLPGPSDDVAAFMKQFPGGQLPYIVRFKYPRKVRTVLPDGVAALDFVQNHLHELGEIQVMDRRAENVGEKMKRRAEIEDLLAETAAGMPEVRRELMETARRGPEMERKLAFWLLGRIPNEDALDFLLGEGLRSRDPKVRITAMDSLCQDQGWNVDGSIDDDSLATSARGGPIGNSRIFHELIGALHAEREPEVQRQLLFALTGNLRDTTFGGNDGKADLEAHPGGISFAAETLAAFSAVLRGSPDPEIRATVLFEIKAHTSPEAARILIEAAHAAPTPKERASAMIALGSSRFAGVDFVPAILDAFGDADRGVRIVAIRSAKAARRDDLVYQRLLPLYRDSVDPEVSSQAFESAMRNLLSNTDRYGEPALPDVVRAELLLSEARGAAARRGTEQRLLSQMAGVIADVKEVSGMPLTPEEQERVAKQMEASDQDLQQENAEEKDAGQIGGRDRR